MLSAIWTGFVTLFLCSFVQGAPADNVLPSAASFYVPSIPGIIPNPDYRLQIYAGHLPAESNKTLLASNDVTAHLYFVMVKNRRVADKERVVFWFNGGPGCSSFDGLMMEVGPWRWDGQPEGKESFIVKEGGWEEYTTMVFVDQPPGTGFSFTSTDQYAKTMKDAQRHILEFLRNFYQVFPEVLTMDTYLAGESFAGQWIPYFADAILESSLQIPLRGIAIGNGWMDARRQYLSYLDYSLKMGLIKDNSEDWKEVKAAHDRCEAHLEKLEGDPIHIRECGSIIMKVINQKRPDNEKGEKMCLNMYDVRFTDTSPACGLNWPPEMHAITHFLGRKDVVRALHAERHPGSWVECRRPVHRAFKDGEEESSITVLPRVLSKIPVLIFAGDQDLICNYVGLENMIKSLTWNGETGLGTVETQSWSVNSTATGTWVESRNLTYVKIFNASHMAPFDLPHVTHDMMLRFMGVNFSSIVGGSAMIPSSLGDAAKPVFVGGHLPQPSTPALPAGKTPEQDKAMWEAYYNAGSAALVLVLIMLVIGLFIWYRRRKSRLQLPSNQSGELAEESIPLRSEMEDRGGNGVSNGGAWKGKARASEPVFEVGDSDEDEPSPYRKPDGGGDRNV
ncbi:KEX1 protein [Coprinopsis cinerea AmutBmut pab1-1]|nr:KEX1 protein [Coprinopsis cinerea AmutBmut pab1-1]